MAAANELTNAIQNVIVASLERNAPKPLTDTDSCQDCGCETDKWGSGWPKSRKITWMCEECSKVRRQQSDKDMQELLKSHLPLLEEQFAARSQERRERE